MLPKEYNDKAHKIDKTYGNTPENQTGPVETKLNSYGDLLGLVVGQFGEVSQDLHNLLISLRRRGLLAYQDLKEFQSAMSFIHS